MRFSELNALDAMSRAAGRVQQHVAGVVPGGPRPIGSGHVGTVGEGRELLAVVRQCANRL